MVSVEEIIVSVAQHGYHDRAVGWRGDLGYLNSRFPGPAVKIRHGTCKLCLNHDLEEVDSVH